MAYINNKYLNIDDILGFNKNAFDSTDAVNNQLMAEGQNLEKQKQDVDSSIKKIDEFSGDRFNNAYADNELDIDEAVGIRDYNEGNQYSGPEAQNIQLKVNERPSSLAQILGEGSSGQKTVNKDLFGTGEGNSRFDALIQSKNDKFQQNKNQALKSANQLNVDAGQGTKSLQDSAKKNIDMAAKFKEDSAKFYNDQKVNVLKNRNNGGSVFDTSKGAKVYETPITATDYEGAKKQLTDQFNPETPNQYSLAEKESISNAIKSNDGKITPELISYIDNKFGKGTAARFGVNAGDTQYFNAGDYLTIDDQYKGDLEPILGSNQVQSLNSLDHILGKGQSLSKEKAGTYIDPTVNLEADKFLGEQAYRKSLNEDIVNIPIQDLFPQGYSPRSSGEASNRSQGDIQSPLYSLYRNMYGKLMSKDLDKKPVNLTTVQVRNMYDEAKRVGDENLAGLLKKYLQPHLQKNAKYGHGDL